MSLPITSRKGWMSGCNKVYLEFLKSFDFPLLVESFLSFPFSYASSAGQPYPVRQLVVPVDKIPNNNKQASIYRYFFIPGVN